MRLYQVFLMSFVILISGPTIGRAVGIDIAPIVAKLTEQLTEMAKQLDEFKKITTATQENIDAIGKVGQITLPTLNVSKLASQIRQDVQCAIPDLSKLMPNVEFDELDWNSVCEASSAYKKTLWLDPDKIKKLETWERLQTISDIEGRRENVLVDAATKGLAQADIATKEIETTNKAIDDVAREADLAKNENERLAVIIQAQIVSARATVQQTQILALMLKVQSALAIKAGVPVESLLSEDESKKAGDAK